MLDKKEVQHISNLARIKFPSDEIEEMRKDLSSILDYIDKLKKVDVENVEPMTHSVDLKNIFRKDKGFSNKDSRELVDLAPDKKDKYIKTNTDMKVLIIGAETLSAEPTGKIATPASCLVMVPVRVFSQVVITAPGYWPVNSFQMVGFMNCSA